MTRFEEPGKRVLTFPAKDRVDGYADADLVYAVADTQAGAHYYAATDAADSDHREQTADDRGEYEVGMFARHAGQMSVALSGVLALPAPSPIQELLLTYRSGTAVHDASLADAVRAARNDYQTLLTPAYAAATAADGLADLAFQWTDDVSAAQDVLQQPGVGPADGQYASYLTTMAHQARETEVRLAREATWPPSPAGKRRERTIWARPRTPSPRL